MVNETLDSTASTSKIKIPVLFIGHGNPINAIEDNEFGRAWGAIAATLPRPKAILCISAHWETNGTRVTAMPQPRTIHDFYGFPQALFDLHYPAPGDPELARLTRQQVHSTEIYPDLDWGLDHGAWSVLCRMYPEAKIPVVQLSLDRTQAPRFHYELGRELKRLRDQGVLIIGSGNLVHNLKLLAWQEMAFDWALEFDEKLKQLILANDHDAIVDYSQWGRLAQLAIPTNEHFLPLLYVLALQEPDDELAFFTEKVTLGSISMRSLRIG